MNDAGWRWMFEMSADNPEAWRKSAENLLRGPRAVGSDIQSGPAGTMDVIVSVQAMLIGMAIECALKALWLKQEGRFKTPGAGFIRNEKLELSVMKGARKHKLEKMATAVGISDVAELELLKRLSWFVSWAGRYPVPLTVQEMVPKNMENSGQVIPRVITVEDLQKAEGLAVRLLEEATSWNTNAAERSRQR